MIGWFSATLAALAVAGLFARFVVPAAARLMLAAAGRWQELSGWSPIVTLTLVVVGPGLMGIAIGIGAFWPGLLGHVMHLCHCGTELLVVEHSSVLHPELSVSLLPLSSVLLVLLLVRPVRVLVASYSAQRLALRTFSAQESSVNFAGRTIKLHRTGNANAFTAGFIFPTIFVDEAWWHVLSNEERGMVVAHEACHQRYWDPLALLIARVSIAFLPASRVAEMVSLIVLQMETRADRQATKSTGNALAVAAFLLRAHQGIPDDSFSLPFGGTSIERRINSLLDSADGNGSISVRLAQWLTFAGVSGMVALTFIFRGFFHRAAEFILATL